MAFLGKDSQADAIRAQRVKDWTQARSPLAVSSGMLGCLAVLDAFTVILGVVLGLAAVGLGVAGLKQINTNPQLVGQRLCYLGIGLGIVGVTTSAVIGFFLYR